MAEDLSIQLGVDASGVLKGMARANKSLQDFKDQAARFKQSLDKATDAASVVRLNKAIEATNARIKSIQAAGLDAGKGLGGIKSGSDTAGQSLVNLGRIAQDAPFGFIGIQNNINPLLESFGRLKAETGSTGGALKALGSSLIGAGGLGLAVSVATGVLTVLAQNGFFKSEKAADAAAESNKRYKESVEGIFADVAKEATQVNTLIAVLKSENETRARKLQALKELTKINPEVFKGLTLEKGAVQGLDLAYQNYIKNIKTVIAVKQKQAQIEDIITKILKLEGAEQTSLTKAISKGIKEIRKEAVAGINNVGGFNNTIQELGQQSELRKLNQDLTDFVAQLSELSGGVKLDIADSKLNSGAAKKEVETISTVIRDLAKEIGFLNQVELTFGTDEADTKIKEIEGTIRKLIKDFKVDPQDSIVQKLLTGGKVFNPVQGFNIPGIKGLQQSIIKTIETQAAAGPTPVITVPVQIQTAIQSLNNQQQGGIPELEQDFTAEIEALSERLTGAVAQSFGDIFEGIGAGASAQGIFSNFFKTIFSELGAGIQELGVKSLITQQIIKRLRDSFATAPGIGASIGLIALGGVIKGLASRIQVPKFADGVSGFSGGLSLVGERGPELVRLPQGSDVIPNHSLGALGGGAFSVTGRIAADGKELVVIFDRANKSLNRVR